VQGVDAGLGYEQMITIESLRRAADLTLRLSSCRFDGASTNEIPGRNPDSKSPRKHHVFKSLLTG
jgi:hypothetical protein